MLQKAQKLVLVHYITKKYFSISMVAIFVKDFCLIWHVTIYFTYEEECPQNALSMSYNLYINLTSELGDKWDGLSLGKWVFFFNFTSIGTTQLSFIFYK